jgi:hypothetical protein
MEVDEKYGIPKLNTEVKKKNGTRIKFLNFYSLLLFNTT